MTTANTQNEYKDENMDEVTMENDFLVENIDVIQNLTVGSFTDEPFLGLSEGLEKVVLGTHRQTILPLLTFFKLNSIFNLDTALDIAVTDILQNEFRFTTIYLLQSTTGNYSFQVISKTSEWLPIVSTYTIYPAFNWAEREIWDLYGIFFVKHSDLRRILTDYGFFGYPLRKDFPVSGFKEVQFIDTLKQVAYSNIELSQSFRLLAFSSNWLNEKTF